MARISRDPWTRAAWSLDRVVRSKWKLCDLNRGKCELLSNTFLKESSMSLQLGP